MTIAPALERLEDAAPVRPRISVVIPTYNGSGRLPVVLAALRRQTLAPTDFEVIVVDDGSTDHSVELVEADGLARLARTPSNMGPGGATNVGIAAARADVIAFTDDDTIPAPDWLEQGLIAIERSPAGLVAGNVELILPERPTTAALVDFGRGYLDQERYVADGFGATANLLARREVLDRLGGFDAGAAWQTHDRDFGERARAAGIPMVYAADATVQHPARDRPRDLAKVSYRLGLGAAWLRSHSVGAPRTARVEWRRGGYWLPQRQIWGLDRLQAAGYGQTLRERLKLCATQYTCLLLPVAIGSLRGSLAEYRRART